MKKTHEWRYYARATWTDGRLYTGVYLLPVKTKTPEAAAAGGGGGDDKPPVDDADVERMMKQMKDGPEKTGKGLSLSLVHLHRSFCFFDFTSRYGLWMIIEGGGGG